MCPSKICYCGLLCFTVNTWTISVNIVYVLITSLATCFHLCLVFFTFLIHVNFKVFIKLFICGIPRPPSPMFFYGCVSPYSVTFFVPYKAKPHFLKTLYERIWWIQQMRNHQCIRFDKIKNLRIAILPKGVIIFPSHIINDCFTSWNFMSKFNCAQPLRSFVNRIPSILNLAGFY